MGTSPPRTKGNPKSPPLPDGGLETLQGSRTGRRRAIHTRRKNSSTTRRNTQTTNSPQKSRYTNKRTSRTRPHHRPLGKTLLVARPEELDGRICPWMCHMSTEQAAYTPLEDPVFPHINQRGDPPLSDSSDGSHHKPSTQSRQRRHPHHRGSRMH